MKTLSFPQVERGKAFITGGEPTKTFSGLWGAIESAYNRHKPLQLRPDDIFNTICCIWAKCIFLNAEKFRSQIVKHEGKKELVYQTTDHDFTSENLQRHFDAFIQLIKDDENKSIEWMQQEFTTTDASDKLVRAAATLASQKAYYEYTSMLCCGFPEIRLMGEDEDWTNLKDLVTKMPVYDENMNVWHKKLLYVLTKFVEANEKDEDFWQAPFTKDGFGSGSPPNYEGWLTVFSPFNEKGQWNAVYSDSENLFYLVEDQKWLDLSVDFVIKLKDESGTHYADLNVVAGPLKYGYKDDCVYVANHIEALKKMLNEPDPVKEKESWDSIEIVSIPIEARPRKLKAKLDDKFVFMPYVPKKRTT